MLKGNWDENNKQDIPGFYNRFRTVAKNTIKVGPNGTYAMPVKANWGPVGIPTKIDSEKLLISTFGNDENYTAYRLGMLALLGSPKELLLYRIADGSEHIAEVKLKNADNADLLVLSSKYPTTRKFNVTVKSNLIDSTKKDLILYEENKKLVEFKELADSIDDIVIAINSNLLNEYIIASKVDGTTGTLDNIANVAFTGGNDGCTSITNENYLTAMDTLERYDFDGFTLDGVTDEQLQTSVCTWISTLKENGTDVLGFVGGDGKGVDAIEKANTRSRAFGNENLINWGCDGIYQGKTYTPAEVAVYIGALAMGQKLQESLCNQETIFEETNTKLKREEIKTCLESGTMIFTKDDGKMVIVDDKNTYTKYTDEKNKILGYVRAVRFLNTVNKDTTIKGIKYLGKQINDELGQIAVISALSAYFEEMAKERIITDDFIVEVDKELQATAENDEFYWRWDAMYINVMKRIFGTGYVE